MDTMTRRATVAELSHHILEMGKTGVYRESIFEALRPLATKKQISEAIAQAKQRGLRTVAHLRDEQLGTYYELDLATYEALHRSTQPIPALAANHDPAGRLAEVTQSITQMLAIARLLFTGSGAIGLLCLFIGQQTIGSSLLISAASIAFVWMLQKNLTQCR